MKSTVRMTVVAATALLALAACGDRPDDDDGGTSGDASDTPSETEVTAEDEQFPDFTACMVSDSGGFDDKSFNQTSYAGMENAATRWGIKTAEIESNSDSEYPNNISALVDQGCNEISTVGFLLADATLAAAKANPEVDFAIVDNVYEGKIPANLKALSFATDEPAFLAGYLAAGMSESGVVGTFGGVQIPTVTIFMDGFWQGVQRYNEDNGAEVQVVGWDFETQEGSFTDSFEDRNVGQNTAENMIQQGADVIMPVAGPAGLGGLQAAQDNDVYGIWVDTDGCVSAAEYCDVLLSSVVKGMDVAVEDAITASIQDEFNNEVYTGTLENEGVGLAPYNELDGEIPQELKDQIDDLRQQIIDGELEVEPAPTS